MAWEEEKGGEETILLRQGGWREERGEKG